MTTPQLFFLMLIAFNTITVFTFGYSKGRIDQINKKEQ